MKAEEFLKERFRIHDKTIYDGENILDFHKAAEVMEAYLQHRVNEISDEDIKNEFGLDEPTKTELKNMDCTYIVKEINEDYKNNINGAKWFKNKLLKNKLDV